MISVALVCAGGELVLNPPKQILKVLTEAVSLDCCALERIRAITAASYWTGHAEARCARVDHICCLPCRSQ